MRGPEDFGRYAQRAYASTFDKTPALDNLWNRAAHNERTGELVTFDTAREKFYRLVNEGTDEDAQTVRDIVRLSGYELQGGGRAPSLRLEGWDQPESQKDARTDWDHAGPQRENKVRELNIDHANPRANAPEHALASKNLRFMLGDDNSSYRGHHFDAQDRPFDIDWYRKKHGFPADWVPSWYPKN